MRDYLFHFESEAAALADPVVGVFAADGAWRGDVCVPGVRVFAVTGTETATDPETGAEYDREIRSYLPGWRMVIASGEPDSALHDHAACTLVADRELAAAELPFVLKSAISSAELAALHLEPMFAGAGYPFGIAP